MNEFHRKEITRKNMNKEVLINKSGPVYSHQYTFIIFLMLFPFCLPLSSHPRMSHSHADYHVFTYILFIPSLFQRSPAHPHVSYQILQHFIPSTRSSHPPLFRPPRRQYHRCCYDCSRGSTSARWSGHRRRHVQDHLLAWKGNAEVVVEISWG